MEQAAVQTGYSDFGPDGFQNGLEATLRGFARIPFTPAARQQVEAKIVSDLATRLAIEQWFKDHPETSDAPVEGPIVVTGMPRTGTTAVVGLMALDPRFRYLRAWEGVQPLPPPQRDDTADPRRLAAHAASSAYSAAKRAQHIHDPDGPEEDLAMLAGLNMHGYQGALPMPDDFLEWWIDEDFTTTYAYHKRVLQLLASRRPPHLWLLKSPPHLFKLEALAAAYPDARFIMTHRDPAKTIPSTCSLQFTRYLDRCEPGSLDPLDYGQRWLNFWARGMQLGLAARARIGEHRFIDIRNSDLIASPTATMARIYAWLGLPLSQKLQGKFETYTSRNQPGAFGEHRYTAEQYGITGAQIRDQFQAYIERFNL
jgi:hypothetical protein